MEDWEEDKEILFRFVLNLCLSCLYFSLLSILCCWAMCFFLFIPILSLPFSLCLSVSVKFYFRCSISFSLLVLIPVLRLLLLWEECWRDFASLVRSYWLLCQSFSFLIHFLKEKESQRKWHLLQLYTCLCFFLWVQIQKPADHPHLHLTLSL